MMATGWGGGLSNSNSSPGWQTSTPTNPFTAGQVEAINNMTGWHAPDLINNDINASRLANQLGYGDAQYGLGVSELQQNNMLDRARLGINAQDIGIDRDSIMRQMGVTDQLSALAGQLFGIDRRGLGLNQDAINSRLGADNRGFTNQRQGLLSQKTQQGSVGSVMHKRGNADITANQHDAWDKFWRDTAGVGLEREKVDVAEKQSGINFKEDKAKLADRLKILDNEAGKLGIDRKQLEANLQQGMARLGVDRLFGMNDILDAMLSNDIDRQAIAQQIFREAMGMSQFFEPFGGTGGATGGGNWSPSASTAPADTERAVGTFMDAMRSGGLR